MNVMKESIEGVYMYECYEGKYCRKVMKESIEGKY
jgi:hypothetical protein